MLGGEISVMTVVVLMAARETQAKKQFNFVILTFTERFDANGHVWARGCIVLANHLTAERNEPQVT